MTAARRALGAALLAAVTTGCSNGAPRARFAPRASAGQTMQEGDSVRVSTTTCPLAPRDPRAARSNAATLLLMPKLVPVPRADAIATVRINGETSRSSVKIDPTQLARFELAPGTYDLQLSLDGYLPATTHVSLTLGCTLQIAPQLTGRAIRR